LQRELDDLAPVHLLASAGVEAEFGAGEVLAQQCRRLAEAVGGAPLLAAVTAP